MSNNINSCVFVGNLVRDAELSYTNSGFAISKLSIAINRSVKKGDNYEDEVSFLDLIGLGRRLESLNQYLTRGQCIGVSSTVKQERWENDGQKRSKIVFIINEIQLLGGKSDSNQPQQGQPQQGQPQQGQSPQGQPSPIAPPPDNIAF